MPKPTTMGARKMVSITPEIAEQIEDFRYGRRFKTEAEAIRRLIELGLEAAGLPSDTSKQERANHESVPRSSRDGISCTNGDRKRAKRPPS